MPPTSGGGWGADPDGRQRKGLLRERLLERRGALAARRALPPRRGGVDIAAHPLAASGTRLRSAGRRLRGRGEHHPGRTRDRSRRAWRGPLGRAARQGALGRSGRPARRAGPLPGGGRRGAAARRRDGRRGTQRVRLLHLPGQADRRERDGPRAATRRSAGPGGRDRRAGAAPAGAGDCPGLGGLHRRRPSARRAPRPTRGCRASRRGHPARGRSACPAPRSRGGPAQARWDARRFDAGRATRPGGPRPRTGRGRTGGDRRRRARLRTAVGHQAGLGGTVTEGERWTREALHRLRSGGYRQRDRVSFLAESLQRAAETRRARPGLASQSRRWGTAGAAACLARRRSRSSLAGLAWWALVWKMVDWHLGMVEGPQGERRERLSAADALTLARFWLAPLAARPSTRSSLAAVVAAGAISDVADGRLAARRGPTRLGRDLDSAADSPFFGA